MFKIHNFKDEMPEIGHEVLVQLDDENTAPAVLNKRDDGTLYWKLAHSNITVIPNGHENWTDIDDLWNMAAETALGTKGGLQ